MQSRVNLIELSGKFWPAAVKCWNEDEKSKAGERKYLTSLRLTCRCYVSSVDGSCIMERRWSEWGVTLLRLALPDRPYFATYAKQFNNFQKNFLIKRQSVRRVRWMGKVAGNKVYWIYICSMAKGGGFDFVHWNNLGIFFI